MGFEGKNGVWRRVCLNENRVAGTTRKDEN